MSYGKEFTINNKTYLIEKSSEYICVAHKYGYDEINDYALYKDLYDEADYEDMYYWEEEKKIINDILRSNYDHGLYCLLVMALDRCGELDFYDSYKNYIAQLVKDGMSDCEILESGSGEKEIYSAYYPTDTTLKDFERITKIALERIKEANNESK